MKVYLAGPINGKSDAECYGWRDEATGLLEARAGRGRQLRVVHRLVRRRYHHCVEAADGFAIPGD